MPYELLSEYLGNKKKMSFKCKECGYVFEATPTNIILTLKRTNGKKIYCPNCNGMIRRNNNDYKKLLKETSPDIINIDEFKNVKTKIRFQCNKCGFIWHSIPHTQMKCPSCSNHGLKSENEFIVTDYIKSLYNGEVINNCFILREDKEIDIYIPELKVAFEIDGMYWHNYELKGTNYHIEKTMLAKERDIRLYHIFDGELNDPRKRGIVFNKIKHILLCDTKCKNINARECNIKEISSGRKDKFLDRYHLQGADRSSIKLGLFYDDKLYAVMTFVKPRVSLGHKKDSKYDYELSRFATKNGYNVRGGFGKLFKHFERNYKWNNIITYADLRWSFGDVYEKNNFKLDHVSRPNYWYFNRKDYVLEYRYNYRKSELQNKFPKLYNKNLSEYEIMSKAGYYKIYDCGNMVFTYQRK